MLHDPRRAHPRARSRRRRVGLATALGALLTVALWWLGPASAVAADDSFDRWDVRYTVTHDGTLQVRETITLRFGSSSGRHGLDRFLVTREPYDDRQDIRYPVSAVTVDSPDRGISTKVDRSSYSPAAREEVERIRIGSASRTILADTATYVIDYSVRGALRVGADERPELYWDVTGPDIAGIDEITVRVQAPGGVWDTACSVAPDGESAPCDSEALDGEDAVFRHADVPRGHIMTIAAQFQQGAVTDAQPLLVERADAGEILARTLGIAGAGAALVGIPLIGWIVVRTRTGDDRYLDVPPGVVPVPGQSDRVGRSRAAVEVPVAFSPPRNVLISDAGFLLDGRYDVRHLTATLVDLAVKGAIDLTSGGGDQAALVDRGRATDDAGRRVLDDVFRSARTRVSLGSAEQMLRASENLALREERNARNNGWFKALGLRPRDSTFPPKALWVAGWLVVVLVLAPSLRGFIPPLLVVGAIVAVFVITVRLVRGRLRSGQRTAHGRALTDQIEGFRTYISTAEADQLRFEEGEDIFTKYLPWAILFGEADRWVRVCRRAVELGRIPAPTLGGLGTGSWETDGFSRRLNTLGRSVRSGSRPTQVHSTGRSFLTSSGGSGGGSAFRSRGGGGGGRRSGGGSSRSGGGGGGGGASSW
ncbi:DUF2207 domain-containing protein [Propioniciclava coleopterorum]|uniref:DUF2207 domain-containing protein n=1 Tax=Propioniciclava coleopterorum TaxID=2714937 RepID=A0A6G7Y9D9_9ACTN|nr:DUF2207 domain-containing protein [Propioniciclava coleopterorum]QIK73251.1 DUF2207 domain-containing protein [Propioniciclava coleopterorum]